MQKGLEPDKHTTCMKCRKATSRYHGNWGEEGLCRDCVVAMETSVRRRVIRDMHPPDRKRWQLDELVSHPRAQQRKDVLPQQKAQAQGTPSREEPPQTSVRREYTEPYRKQAVSEAQETAHDRRRHTRVYEQLPTRFSLTTTPSRAAQPLLGRAFRSLTKDISGGGVRIRISDNVLFGVPAGSGLRMEISLQAMPAVVRCTGVVRNVVRTSRGRDPGYLCVQFDRLSPTVSEELQRYVTARKTRSRN